MNHADSITDDSTETKPKSQHDSAKYGLLQKLMSWDSHDPQDNTNYTTAQVSTFFTITVTRNFAYGTSVSWNVHDPNSTTKQASEFPREPYHTNLLMENSLPVTLHRHQMTHN